jgi:hypothetical protein
VVIPVTKDFTRVGTAGTVRILVGDLPDKQAIDLIGQNARKSTANRGSARQPILQKDWMSKYQDHDFTAVKFEATICSD